MNKKATESILVCVNQVVNIQPSANGYCARGHEIELFYQQCKEAGAELTILFDDDFAGATAKFARKTGAKQVVTQLFSSESGGPDTFAEALHRLAPTLPISIYPNYRPRVFQKTSSVG